MPAAVDECPQGHDTRSNTARDSQGHCRLCMAERKRHKRVSDSMRLTLVKAFEAAGVQVEDGDGKPVAAAEVVRQLVATYEAGAFNTES